MVALKNLITAYGANGFILADAGNGSADSDGSFVQWDEDTAVYGDVEMGALDTVQITGGVECEYASDWIIDGDGDNPYRYRIFF